jgi:hypothetical protein
LPIQRSLLALQRAFSIHRRHHAFADRPGATVIRIFERLGWATGVRWPILARLDDRRRSPGCHGTMS